MALLSLTCLLLEKHRRTRKRRRRCWTSLWITRRPQLGFCEIQIEELVAEFRAMFRMDKVAFNSLVLNISLNSSLLHSVNFILFTVLLVHLILHISPHHSHHLRSHHLSLPLPSTPDLKLISFTNPFLQSLLFLPD